MMLVRYWKNIIEEKLVAKILEVARWPFIFKEGELYINQKKNQEQNFQNKLVGVRTTSQN